MTISLPSAKLATLSHFLQSEWPADRLYASAKEVRSLLRKLLRICEVARAGKKSYVARSTSWAYLRLFLDVTGFPTGATWTPEFHADVEFWRLLLEGALGSPVGTLHASLYSFCSQPYSRTLWSDASGDAMGGYCSESGA